MTQGAFGKLMSCFRSLFRIQDLYFLYACLLTILLTRRVNGCWWYFRDMSVMMQEMCDWITCRCYWLSSWSRNFYIFSSFSLQNDVFVINTLKPRHNGCHFPDDLFKCIFLNENLWTSIQSSLKFVHKAPIKNISALVQIMACRLVGAIIWTNAEIFIIGPLSTNFNKLLV